MDAISKAVGARSNRLWTSEFAWRTRGGTLHGVGDILIGSEALATEEVSRYELRSRFTRLYPDVYVPPETPLTVGLRSEAAWLWSGRKAVIAGMPAAKLNGVEWVDDNESIELIGGNARSPKGIVTRSDVMLADEVKTIGGLPVTTPVRTAYDLGRRGELRAAVARVDGLMRFAGVTKSAVEDLISRHPHTRGLRKLEQVLRVADGGAESPRETYLRLLINETGDFPPLVTQIPVPKPDGLSNYFLDMGWVDVKIAVEYDGEDHQRDPDKFADDIVRLEYLQQRGWIVIRVIAKNHRAEILRRIRRSFELRLHSGLLV